MRARAAGARAGGRRLDANRRYRPGGGFERWWFDDRRRRGLRRRRRRCRSDCRRRLRPCSITGHGLAAPNSASGCRHWRAPIWPVKSAASGRRKNRQRSTPDRGQCAPRGPVAGMADVAMLDLLQLGHHERGPLGRLRRAMLSMKALYPAGGHDYHNHYFRFFPQFMTSPRHWWGVARSKAGGLLGERPTVSSEIRAA
jgi:hypothetical protein